MPGALDVPHPLPDPNFPKAALSVQGTTRLVFGNNVRLKRPKRFGFGYINQAQKQGCANALSFSFLLYIDADLSEPSRPSSVGHSA
jgi:hypothetical protein